MLAKDVATEFARYQIPQVRPQKSTAQAGWLDSYFTPTIKRPKKPKDIAEYQIIKDLQRLFDISVPNATGPDVYSKVADHRSDGCLTEQGIRQVQKGTHVCSNLLSTKDIDVWDFPPYSWESETLLEVSRWLEGKVQEQLGVPQEGWPNHWMYGKARILAWKNLYRVIVMILAAIVMKYDLGVLFYPILILAMFLIVLVESV